MKKCWKIRNAADSSEEAELLIYGDISDETWWGDEVTPRQFHDDLATLEGKDLCVRINSGGGDVFAAVAIYNQLKTYGGKVTTRIDGLAASAATIIACAGEQVIMPRNALFMIHNPAMFAFGGYDANEMRECAEQLDVVKQTIVNTYLTRSSLSEEELCQMMDDETWMTADEALDYGFVDTIDEKEAVTNSLRGGRLIMNSVSCDLSRYKNAAQLEELLQNRTKNTAVRVEKGGKKMGNTNNTITEKIDRIINFLGMGNADNQPTDHQEMAPKKTATDDAVSQERQRMMALDALDDHKGGAISKMVDEAKRNGTSAEQLKPFLDIAKAQDDANAENGKAAQAIKDLVHDNLESGAAGVQASMPAVKDADKQAAIDAVVACANRK